MKRGFYKLLSVFALVTCSLLIAGKDIIQNCGIYVNLWDESMPPGIYQRVNTKPDDGMLGITCLTAEIARYGLERGYLRSGKCPTGTMPVLKWIEGRSDVPIIREKSCIIVNGRKYDVAQYDSKGRRLRKFDIDEFSGRETYWLLSDHKKNSWDSRYWGPVEVLYVVKKIF